MSNDFMLGGLYLLMAMMLVLGALMTRREPLAKLLTMAVAWIAIFGAGFVLFTFRDNFGWVAQRLKAEAVGTPVQQGRETRSHGCRRSSTPRPTCPARARRRGPRWGRSGAGSTPRRAAARSRPCAARCANKQPISKIAFAIRRWHA